jgi:endo-1,4-beta-xylanase
MIVVAFGFTGNGDTTFVDSTGHWALPQIETAAFNDLVTGVTKSNGTYFLPDDKISREQVAAILYRVAVKRGITLPETAPAIAFSDQGSISSYAAPAVAAMQKAGTISGSDSNGNTVFAPQGYATRAQAVKMIQGLLELH